MDGFVRNTHQKVRRTDKFYSIPLCSILEKLMNLDSYQAEILNPHQSSENTLRDFCDGSFYKSHPLFSCDPHALQVIGYYDDLEVVNPLGSYVKKHKLGCLFFFLGNVRPQFRSTLKSIHLLAVGKTEHIQHYGMNKFLSPFVDDLKKLYCDGIDVIIAGVNKVFRGALVAFLADTLAAHGVGGFKCSMSFALRICRTCMCTSPQIQECFLESACTLRTKESYFEQCSFLVGPLRAHFSKTYGINFMSVLEEAPGYSVVSGLPHDIMHDLYEGVIPYEMKLLLKHCVSCKYFNLDELNTRIEQLGFIKNKPRLLDPAIIRNEDTKIRQSASQMIALSHHFALLIADKIPYDDSNWKSFLLLLRICAIAQSPIITQDTIEYLRILIEEKLRHFKQVYPNVKLLPKHHYMVHYPSQMERMGPLVHSWTMRHEAKLSFVKRVSHQSNFKNICKTVAMKHQFWMCYQHQTNPHIFLAHTSFSPKCKVCHLYSEDNCVQNEFIRVIPSISMDSEIKHFEWVQVQNSHLQKGSFIMLKFDIDRPTFCKVVDILCFESTLLIYGQMYVGEVFNSHYNAFCIKSNGEFTVFDLLTLHDYRHISVKLSFVPYDKELYAMLPYYY